MASFRDLQQEINDLAERAGNTRPVLREIAEDYREAQRENFRRGGKPKWKPLTPEYAARKALAVPGRKVGVYTGRLRDSLIRKNAPYSLEKITDHELQVGTRNPVANLFNSKHSGRNQPKRKVQALTPQMRRDFLAKVQDYLAGES